MSRPAKRLSLSGPDTLFAGLVGRVHEAGWDSPEGRQLLESVLPALVRPLAGRFPDLESGEAFHLAWKIAKRPGLLQADYPRTWLVTAVRRELESRSRDRRKSQRDLVDDIDQAKARSRQEGISYSENGVPDGLFPESLMEVWDELLGLLMRLRWPKDLASKAVELLRARAETGQVSIEETARNLHFLPKGPREPLARIVFTKPGFFWARLHGISWARAVALSADDLASLVLKPEAWQSARLAGA